MAARISIKKVVTAIFWCFAGTGGVILLVAAIRYRNSNVCKGYKIEIMRSKTTSSLFIDRKGIVRKIVTGEMSEAALRAAFDQISA